MYINDKESLNNSSLTVSKSELLIAIGSNYSPGPVV